VAALLGGIFFDATTTSYARALVWLVPISAIARTALNYHQGVKSVHRVSLVAAVMSVVSLVLTVLLVDRWRLTGWLGARYLSEALLAGTMLWTVRRVLRARTSAPTMFSYGNLLHLGIAIAASLLVRTGVDNIGVLAMGFAGVARSDIGYFGVASLIASGLLLVPGALANLSLPAIIDSFAVRRGAERTAIRLLAAGLAFSLPLVGILMWLAPTLARLFAPAYLPGIPVIRILLIAVPLRAATSTAGAVLLAGGRVHSTLVINLLTLGVGIAALGLLVPAHGATGAAIATVLMEIFATFGALAWAIRAVRIGPLPRLAQA
jgi:O-antigen/teichoic acid export membrane protein